MMKFDATLNVLINVNEEGVEEYTPMGYLNDSYIFKLVSTNQLELDSFLAYQQAKSKEAFNDGYEYGVSSFE